MNGKAGGRGNRGADRLVEGLVAAGVRRVFTLSGNQIMPVFDACLDHGIELVHVRHEAAAVHMADAWGRMTEQPGVAMVTGGPGHANAVSALFTARGSESPMVLLSGHAPRARLGHGAFQEMAQAEMAAPVSKASWTVATADDFGRDVQRALHVAASGRPGPVHVSLPFDLLNAQADNAAMDFEADRAADDSRADAAAAAIAEQIASASRPLILGGSHLLRVADASRREALGEALGAPVVASESPRGINDPALGAFAEVLAQADLVIAFCRPVDFTLQFGREGVVDPEAKFVLVDPEPESLVRSRRAIGDAGRIVFESNVDTVSLVAAVERRTGGSSGSRDWFREVEAAVSHRPAEWAAIAGEDALHAVEVGRAVQASIDAASAPVLVMDGGEFGQWMQALVSAPVRLLNGPAGAIGSALPMAIAAKSARPEATVFALLGDGTFGFHMAEYDTAVRSGLPFVGIVGNDACWNAEHQIQIRDYGADRTIGCELKPTRYDRVAVAMGAHGEHVTRAEDLQPAIERAIRSGKPACINVAIERRAAPVVRRNG